MTLQRKTWIALALLALGALLLFFSVHSAFYVGAPWFNERASEAWHMNNYFIVPGLVAFIGFAFVPWLFGGVLIGVFVPAVYCLRGKGRRWLIVLALAMSGLIALGFNTFDFMLGCFYWTNMTEPAPVLVDLVFCAFYMNAWDFYFFGFLVPLLAGGFCFGASGALAACKLKI